MAEGVADRPVDGVVVAVADEEALAVADVALVAREVQVGRGVLQADRHRLREAAGRVGLAEEHVGDRAAAGLAAEPTFDQGLHSVLPRADRDHRSVGQYHHQPVCCGGDGIEHGQLVGREVDVGAVVPLGLVARWEAQEQDRGVGERRLLDGFVEQRSRIDGGVVDAEAGSEVDGHVVAHAVSQCGEGIVDAGGVDLRAAGPLEPGGPGELPDHREVLHVG